MIRIETIKPIIDNNSFLHYYVVMINTELMIFSIINIYGKEKINQNGIMDAYIDHCKYYGYINFS